ncbi:pyruvate dehydrogenase E1 component beta subunit [Stella humosa]|uniref:Pyruvate dehydrogenase E1 component beta subunit n=1 Tax=Stella humosa TaxID=94 RepID=A0A3N1MKI0_9PROT|nr:transketolase C-terminal domain-containing protein [Stella humosa]ROQ03327.1 pyruvate dehydrogenase E1 component beta subunit [Stella humosa]BBK29614.1 pyruvate dehydrogenase subunit beta [Stella humosa]
MTELTYLDAGRTALAEEMRRDGRVWALGEDLGRGGVFGQYRGLVDEFGPARIADTPISEATIMGAAVGAALVGSRPVVEMRFSDFALCAVDELVNQAAKARYMFGGQGRVPLVVRQPIGMWRSSAAQHSQSLEAWYAHIPGLVVVAPATPADNYGLLKSAIRCDDPVVYMEHKDLWPAVGHVPVDAEGGLVPLGHGRLVQAGSDLTIVTWSRMVDVAMAAAALPDVPSIEVIDLRTLWPWDRAMVLDSVARTGRCLVVHEAVQAGGFGGEIAATVGEELFGRLKAPVRRLGAPRIPVAYAPVLEETSRITAAQVADAARRMV